MKIKRRKQAKHLLTAYRNFFGFREPYQILVDGTFCKMSVQHNVNIKEQLAKYLQSEIQCLTTRCVVAELEMLGDAMFGAKVVARRFKTQSCKHRKKPVHAQTCLKSLLDEENSKKFFLATQDFKLTKLASKIPGVPLLYFHQNNIILNKMSEVTLKQVDDISQGKAEPSPALRGSIWSMKKEANLASDIGMTRKKRKRPKGPNPLSCKKSKKVKTEQPSSRDNNIKKKRKRNRKSTLTVAEKE